MLCRLSPQDLEYTLGWSSSIIDACLQLLNTFRLKTKGAKDTDQWVMLWGPLGGAFDDIRTAIGVIGDTLVSRLEGNAVIVGRPCKMIGSDGDRVPVLFASVPLLSFNGSSSISMSAGHLIDPAGVLAPFVQQGWHYTDRNKVEFMEVLPGPQAHPGSG